MKTNTIVIINGSYGNQLSDLETNLLWGFNYLDIEPDFFYNIENVKDLDKYEYLVYISLNNFEKERYNLIKDNFKNSLFLSNEILEKDKTYEFFNKLHEFYNKDFIEKKNIEFRLKNINYQTNYKKIIEIKKLFSENNIPFSVSIEDIVIQDNETIPITLNKKLTEELYTGNYKISSKHRDKQMVISITNVNEINNLFYLSYLKSYDVLLEISSDMKQEDIYRIIQIMQNEHVKFSVSQNTETLKINNVEYSAIKKNSNYFSFLLIFVIIFFILIFYRLYKRSRENLFKRRNL